MPNKFMINSTDEFLAILKSTSPNGIMASLDVENLFTNIPLIETIDIIINKCYNHETIEAPKILGLVILMIIITNNDIFSFIINKSCF